jgi:hypothetical protein
MVSSLGDYLSVETQHQKVERNGETWLPNPEVYFQGILILESDMSYIELSCFHEIVTFLIGTCGGEGD